MFSTEIDWNQNMSETNQVALTGYDRIDEAKMRTRIEDFHERLSRRRSIRMFSPDPVPKDIIEISKPNQKSATPPKRKSVSFTASAHPRNGLMH